MQPPNKNRGFVSIVGAGPGDPELMTIKAVIALERAEVVVYDRLVSDEILRLVPEGVTRIFAGKSCKQHYMTQEEINTLLVTLAQTGRRVVRLKGGDPFIFGRGGEEAEYLAQHNIAFEIIPGISSASGCAAYAGIPLTHRGLATGVRFLTGHIMENGEPKLNWASLADADTTLVIYMGLANLAFICDKLIMHGLDISTPTAAIQEGTTNAERWVISTLEHIHRDVIEQQLTSPSLIIIGKVVALSETLRWFVPQVEKRVTEGVA